MTPEEFVRRFRDYAVSIQEETGIPWPVIIAQAALETGWLQNPVVDLYTGHHSFNLFNLKGMGPAGSVKALDTEYAYGRARKVVSEFRAYHSYEESMEDYARLLSESKRYAPVFQVAWSPEEFARGLQAAGYAQDPQYADKLISIMRRYININENY